MTLFITGNQAKHREVALLLGDLEVRPRKLALARPKQTTLTELAAARVLEAHAKVGEPCFTESTQLELDGLAPMSGAEFKRGLLTLGEAALCRRLGGRRGRVRVAVAYTADGNPDEVAVFEGSVEGTFLEAPRGTGGYGWDRAWLPDGYRRTLAEMAGNKAFANMRQRPYVELAALLRGRSDAGSFEAHVTVAPGDPEYVERFTTICDQLAVKAVVIELPRGETRSQPMTASYHHGSLQAVLAEVHELARQIAAQELEVTRVKLEAVGKNPMTPQTDAAARAAPNNYFEYHVKLLLGPDDDLAAIEAACLAHGAHLSRNARKLRTDGLAERFVTQRVYGLGRPGAELEFAALLEQLRPLELRYGQRIREYTVYDSNAAVDRGWLE
jgi:inosine/xanthosine triphosphate pyrophosphatase family protein